MTNEKLPLGVLLYGTLRACDRFSMVLSYIVQCPSPIAPDMHLFMRGYLNKSFVRILTEADERLTSLGR